MDAVKFVKEYLRMCTKVDECEDCPVCKTDFCTVPAKERSQESAEEIVKLVEQWSTAHPRETRQSMFLKQWPCAKVDDTGILCIYPCDLDKSEASGKNCDGFSCSDCRREFWMQEV